MKMKSLLYFLLFVFFISCNENKNNQNDNVLDALVFNSYEYINASTAHVDSLSPYRQDIIRLKQLADNAILINNSESNNAAFEEFDNHVENIMQDYNGNNKLIISSLTSVIDNSLYSKIRFLEYVAINTIIRDFYYYYFTFNTYSIIVVPDKPIVELGETYTAKIYLAANDFYSPIKLVAENDTIESCDNWRTPIFSITPNNKGRFSHEAEVIINYRGKKLPMPFRINYEVK